MTIYVGGISNEGSMHHLDIVENAVKRHRSCKIGLLTKDRTGHIVPVAHAQRAEVKPYRRRISLMATTSFALKLVAADHCSAFA